MPEPTPELTPSPSAAPANARAEAARILATWLKTGAFPDRLIAEDTPDRGFVVEVVYGVARRRRSLEWIATQLAPRRPPTDAAAVLMTGLYQLLFMDSVADYAAVSETVAAARHGPHFAAGFVNAVLRRAARERERLLNDLRAQPLAVRESHPDELVERWVRRFGPVETDALCRWNNSRPPVIIRPNRRLIEADALLERLRQAGVEAVPHPAAGAHGLVLPHGVRVTALPGYAEGTFTVQDPSTTAAVDLLDVQPGQTVLDACAAPGGKTALIAERLGGRGQLVAADTHDDRLTFLRGTVERLKLETVTIVRADASRDDGFPAPFTDTRFDRILLDVPCTNTGVLRRRPDARWRFSAERLDRLNALQRAMLDAVAPRLRPGGTLVYSTCSLEPEENADLVAAWLAGHPDFRRLRESQLVPPGSQTDGAYAAALRRDG